MVSSGMPLSLRFYRRPTVALAHDLLGKLLCSEGPAGRVTGRIVETEAYLGHGDPACHAARGRTERNAGMFGPAGMAYVYFIYGMYHCFNVVSEPEGTAGAVLIRALEPVDGIELMRQRRGRERLRDLASGPGKLCIALDIQRADDGCDLLGERIWLESQRRRRPASISTTRIGISSGKQLPWRFCVADSPYLSGKVIPMLG